MNTRQKLTLGIAAIFMVTLTIVGVTYAYFVTRVIDPQSPANATVETVSLGTIKYVTGNGASDVITISDVQPGAKVYKTFAVENSGDIGSEAGSYYITATNNVTAGKGEFIHTAASSAEGDVRKAGENIGTVLSTCYAYNANPGTIGSNYIQPTELKMSTEDGAEPMCFEKTEGVTSVYNNITLNVYKVDKTTYETTYATVNTNTTSYLEEGDEGYAAAIAPDVEALVSGKKLTFSDTDIISDKLTLAPGTAANTCVGEGANPEDVCSYDYYVVEVIYDETDYNQNAENLAGIDIRLSIQA